MDHEDYLSVRFHFKGHFVNDGKKMHYVGGQIGMSEIERDKMSMPEVRGHLQDHTRLSIAEIEGIKLHCRDRDLGDLDWAESNMANNPAQLATLPKPPPKPALIGVVG